MGSSFTATGQAKDEISGRTALARSALTRLKATLLSRREISLKMKGRIYEALVGTTFLYSCEIWQGGEQPSQYGFQITGTDCHLKWSLPLQSKPSNDFWILPRHLSSHTSYRPDFTEHEGMFTICLKFHCYAFWPPTWSQVRSRRYITNLH